MGDDKMANYSMDADRSYTRRTLSPRQSVWISFVLAFAAFATSAMASVTVYLDQAHFYADAAPLRTLNFIDGPISTLPSEAPYTGLYDINFAGVCFQRVYNAWNLAVYTFPSLPMLVNLPTSTYAVGFGLTGYYNAPGTFTVTLSTGETYNVPRSDPAQSYYFGAISTAPIAWFTLSFDGTYPTINSSHWYSPGELALTASAGSVAGCPAPKDAAGPVVAAFTVAPNPVSVNTPVSLSAGVDDTNTGGSMIAAAEYSIDGGQWMPMGGTFNTSSSVNVSAQLAPILSPGVYNVCARGIDAVGNFGGSECVLLPVFDPAGGFVTGGGWIESPAGAYTPDPGLTGKATFGFVSEYKKGANVPTGNTQFVFHSAKMNFKSAAYQWMVVSGARVQYKGSGTIGGEPGYDFLLTAIDGDLTGGGSSGDRLRIKIWNDSGITYDNQVGEGDRADPTTALGGGSIIIKK